MPSPSDPHAPLGSIARSDVVGGTSPTQEDAADASTLALATTLASHLRRWSLQRGASAVSADAVAMAARRLSLATSEGHVCQTINDRATRAALLASTVVQSHPRAKDVGRLPDLPLVLDSQGRLYVHRTFDDEAQLAARLVHAVRHARMPPVDNAVLQTFERLFDDLARAHPVDGTLDAQRLVVALALVQPVVVVSGGPGTGKTTTLVHLLACLRVQDPTLRIGLAAPTGKAAARMAAALGPDAPPAQTVHAWLGMHARTGLARYNAHHPLPLDMLVVDEASMLDLALARRLMFALPSHARVVLLGDKDQLAAVEAGAVFAELASNAVKDDATIHRLAPLFRATAAAGLRDAVGSTGCLNTVLSNGVVWLSRNHRFDAKSGIGRLATCIRDGDADAALALLTQGDATDLTWIRNDADQHPRSPTLETTLAPLAQRRLETYASAIETAMLDPAAAGVLQTLRAFEGFRMLSAMREGPWGVLALNRVVTRWLRQRLSTSLTHAATPSDDWAPWFAGRAVMVTRNDPALRLNNGDVGITLPPRGAMPWRVAFIASTGDVAEWPTHRLAHVETAFASTVHKAQGSEYEAVAVVLPPTWSRSCTRELLYTAVTRARRHVTLVASTTTLRRCIDTRTQRAGGLGDRLREADESTPRASDTSRRA